MDCLLSPEMGMLIPSFVDCVFWFLYFVRIQSAHGRPAPMGELVQCVVSRDKSGMDKMHPTYYLKLQRKDDDTKVVCVCVCVYVVCVCVSVSETLACYIHFCYYLPSIYLIPRSRT